MKILFMLSLVLLAVLVRCVGVTNTIPFAATANVTFTYQAATEYEDGTPLPLEEIKYTRLYCDGELVAQEAGAKGDIYAELIAGYHSCYATHVATNDLESIPSNTVEKFVEVYADMSARPE